MIKDYASEIEDAYQAVRDSSNADIPLPASWALEDCVEFTRNVLKKLLGKTVGDDEDIFGLGADRSVGFPYRNWVSEKSHFCICTCI